jgi:transcription-repair coupling factor (superfamily II helicase)
MKEKKFKKEIEEYLSGIICPDSVLSMVDPAVLAPLLLKLVEKTTEKSVVVVLPILSMVENLAAELEIWKNFMGKGPDVFTLPETSEGKSYFLENEAGRSRLIYRYLSSEVNFLLTSVKAVMDSSPKPEKLFDSCIELKKGMDIGFSDLLAKLLELDYDDEFEVTVPGEFSRRGGIIDVFSPAYDFPVRLEFWGDTLDSIRRFCPESQRTIEEIDEYKIIIRSTLIETDSDCCFLDYTRKNNSKLIVAFPEQCELHLKRFGEEEQVQTWLQRLNEQETETVRLLDTVESAKANSASPCGFYPAAAHIHGQLPAEIESGYGSLVKQLCVDQIKQWLDSGYSITLTGTNDGGCEHLKQWITEAEFKQNELSVVQAELPHGIIFPEFKKVFLTEKEIFTGSASRYGTNYQKVPDGNKSTDIIPQEALQGTSMADLEEGDYAVHIQYGIGIYRGINEIGSRGSKQEVICLEFADGAMAYIPLYQTHMISRYIGSKRGIVSLSKLGSSRWSKSKIAAARSVRDLALEMLKVQAMRSSSKGYAFPADDVTQRIFEESFPFPDTPDQQRSTEEVKKDMSLDKPMDRLLCGDVGYGKTEVAIRAAFKSVMDGKQVAILVPTTILAQQHYYSFTERFAEYPVIIEMLSRFKSGSEQKKILNDLKDGKIDIIIGTHRLVQGDVGFSDLGLVVIDEEQRFGVTHKEKFKKLRTTVDVLTMTATPIPRTLYMSMAGVRNLSTIMTSPGQRLPVRTVVSQYDEEIITSAIEREVQRGGQVFYLHNRVKTIEQTRKILSELLPEVNFAVAHGRMEENELEQIMAEFLEGKVDVLISTTIIESGLDIPNANTIIIERADRFGLAELYQLRGRVGRWTRQAYAYLLLPKQNILTGDARKRIAAIRKYTHLGAGFKLALRDLEIRGAGNLLGAEQSGHIHNVGFELYCQLLRSTVAQLQGQTIEVTPEVELALDFVIFGHRAEKNKIAAGIPPDYIESERLRLEAYRKLGALTKSSQVDELAEEFVDRYGNLPECTVNMLKIMKIKFLVSKFGAHSLKVSGKKIMIEGARGLFKQNRNCPEFQSSNLDSKLDELLEFLKKITKKE